jgi:nucleoside-diphosphate-sugar epimerase|tara:strand:+ start:5790 stop:7166 length:1377 start_codon:yes stop_codon:yes gene_type:complete
LIEKQTKNITLLNEKMRTSTTPTISFSSFSSSFSSRSRRRRLIRSFPSRSSSCSSSHEEQQQEEEEQGKKIFFAFGFGYCAIGVANQLLKTKKKKKKSNNNNEILGEKEEDFAWIVVGTTRSREKAEALNLRSNGTWCEEVFTWKSDDGEPLQEECARWLKKADVILISTPPNGDLDLDPILSTKAVREVLENAKKRQMFIYLSSTGVYGGHLGEWVDETTEPNPDSIVAQRRLNAEKAWTEWVVNGNKRNNVKSSLRIFRLGGIYGPGRSAIDIASKRERERQFQEKTRRKEVETQSEDNSNTYSIKKSDNANTRSLTPTQISRRKKMYTSRIHVADVANALVRCIEKEVSDEEEDTVFIDDDNRVAIYNVVDDYPSSRDEAVDFAASLLSSEIKNEGNEKSGEKDILLPDKSEKRVKNVKLKRAFASSSSSSSSLLFPSYKEGLTAIYDGNQIPFD